MHETDDDDDDDDDGSFPDLAVVDELVLATHCSHYRYFERYNHQKNSQPRSHRSTMHSFLLLLIPLLSVVADAFLTPSVMVVPTRITAASSSPGTSRTTSTTRLYAASPKKLKPPTFNKATQKWERAPGDDGQYPYDAVGALLRHGPSSFLSRISNPTEYEQGILKYMAATGVSRSEATGNMDAKLGNAADWAFQKLAEKNGAPKVDYTKLDRKNTILRVVWALFITPLVISVILQTVSQFEGPHPPTPL